MGDTRKNLKLPTELVEDIERFQDENYFSSFTSALVELTRRSLELEDEKKEKQKGL